MKILIVAKVEHCLLAFISVAAGFRMLIPAARPLFESIFASPLKPGSCLSPPSLPRQTLQSLRSRMYECENTLAGFRLKSGILSSVLSSVHGKSWAKALLYKIKISRQLF